jgi:formate hydrogenlyase subunit 4
VLKFFIYILIALSPFLFLGIINRIKALWAGRKGSSVLQPYYDFSKLLKKGEVISRTTSFVFRISPSINVAAVLFALTMVPLPFIGSLIKFPGDFILFTYTLGFAKFFTVCAALDTGSSFEGMGASREVTFSSIVEPAFFIILGSLALITGELSFQSIFAVINTSTGYTILIKLLFVASLFIMLLTEGSRVPVDDPNTHLELTMIHEVMILDYSGPDLAFILYSSGLKMVIFSMLIAALLIPPSINLFTALGLFFMIIVLIFIGIAAVESLIARSRMSHVPQFIFLMTALSITAFAVILFFLYGGF